MTRAATPLAKIPTKIPTTRPRERLASVRLPPAAGRAAGCCLAGGSRGT
jgi:hypothetical protein